MKYQLVNWSSDLLQQADFCFKGFAALKNEMTERVAATHAKQGFSCTLGPRDKQDIYLKKNKT